MFFVFFVFCPRGGCLVVADPPLLFSSDSPLGYAYVNFYQMADAERALDSLNYSLVKVAQNK